MRCRYREKLFECGEYLEASIYPAYKTASTRKKKYKPTPEVMQKVNDMNAERKLIRILNANFTEDDLKIELTYDNKHLPQTDEESARCLANFLRRLKRYRNKLDLPELKYVAVTEKGSRGGRYHHHLVISGGISPKEIMKIWGNGYVHTDALRFNETGLAELGRYMLKRSVASSKKWNSSKNLIHPVAKHRDGRLSKRDVMELARDTENAREYEKHFKGWYLSEAHKIINDVNGGVYIHAIFRRE